MEVSPAHFSLAFPQSTLRFCCHPVARPGQPRSPSCFDSEILRPPPHSGIDCHRSHCPSEKYDDGEDIYPLLQYPRQQHRCPRRRTEQNCPTCPSPESSLESLFVFLSRVPCPVSSSTQHKRRVVSVTCAFWNDKTPVLQKPRIRCLHVLEPHRKRTLRNEKTLERITPDLHYTTNVQSSERFQVELDTRLKSQFSLHGVCSRSICNINFWIIRIAL